MKKIYSTWMCLLMVLGLAFGNVQIKACNNSDYVLDSLTFDGTNYTIYSTLCIGGGILGAIKGGDNATSTLGLGFYSPDGTMALSSFSPNAIQGDSTGCPFSGFGPAASLEGSNFSVVYFPTTGCTDLLCVNSTAICGRPHAQCFNFVHVLNVLPDSIIALAVEGTGNTEAGCYPGDSPAGEDMVIDFTILPVVWGGLNAKAKDTEVEIVWSTLSESNTDYFDVLRSADGAEWESLGNVNAARNSDGVRSYSFDDPQPAKGINRYRIVQYDLNGQSAKSEVVSVSFAHEHGFEWAGIGPVPATEHLNVEFTSPGDEDVKLSLYDASGKLVLKHNMAASYGINSARFDLSSIESGVYFLRLNGASGSLHHKVIKQ